MSSRIIRRSSSTPQFSAMNEPSSAMPLAQNPSRCGSQSRNTNGNAGAVHSPSSSTSPLMTAHHQPGSSVSNGRRHAYWSSTIFAALELEIHPDQSHEYEDAGSIL